MSIQALNSSRALRFNAQPQRAINGDTTIDDLIALLQSVKSNQASVPQAAANTSSPTNTSTTNQSSSPNLLMRAIDLSALLFLAALVGTFGMNLLNKWGLTDSEGKFKRIPDRLFSLKIDKDLPETLLNSLNKAWTEIGDTYKKGFDAEKDDLTVGHYLDAFYKMFNAEPDKAIELAGQTHGLLKEYFEKNLTGFTKWWKGFSDIFSEKQTSGSSQSTGLKEIIVTDENDPTVVSKGPLEIANKIDSLLDTVGPQTRPGQREWINLEETPEVNLNKAAEFISNLRVTLTTIPAHLQRDTSFQLVNGYVNKVFPSTETKIKEEFAAEESKSKAVGFWNRLLQEVEGLTKYLKDNPNELTFSST